MGAVRRVTARSLGKMCRPVRAPPKGDLTQSAQLHCGISGQQVPLLPLEEPLPEPLRLNVDEFYLGGMVKDPVRDPVGRRGPGHGGHGFLDAFDVRNIQRGIDVDPCLQQLLNILVAPHVPGFLRVQVGKLIDQDQLRTPLQAGVQIQLLHGPAIFLHFLPEQRLKTGGGRCGFRPWAVGKRPNDRVRAGPPRLLPRLQHPAARSRSRKITDKDREPPLFLYRRSSQCVPVHIKPSLQTALL